MRSYFLIGFLIFVGCTPHVSEKTEAGTQDAPAKQVVFTEISHEAGIDFIHVNGGRGQKRMPETVGSGLAFFDYNNDGKLDLLIINSSSWPGDKKPLKTTPKLYENLGTGKFKEVTEQAGLAFTQYGMGVAVGDIDNDGWEDLYFTAVGPNHLFHNQQGKFVDTTAAAGVVGVPLPDIKLEHKWSSSAAWLDYDRDGNLDLFVCQYVKWSPSLDPYCGKNGVRGYCPPGTFEGARNTLFHNEGAGKFRDVTKEAGLFDIALGKSFGIAIADYNSDGWPDIAVANDTWANFLLINEAGKHFTDKGIESGIAFAESGKAKAGIDVADFRNNGQFGMVIGNFAEEGLSLFEPMTGVPGMFENQAQTRGLVSASMLNVTFATFFFDFDLDGWQDIFATNGHVDDIVSTYKSNLTFKQKPLLFHNEKGERFVSVTKESKLDFPIVGRGATYGDIDNDGDLDVGVVDNGGRFLLLRNDGGNQNKWIRFKLMGVTVNRDAIGALVKIKSGNIHQQQYVRSGTSFLTESQRELTFGLGKSNSVEEVEILWPDGKIEKIDNLQVNQQYTITQGKGLNK
jgi:enediyne biosynthesis protein E4